MLLGIFLSCSTISDSGAVLSGLCSLENGQNSDHGLDRTQAYEGRYSGSRFLIRRRNMILMNQIIMIGNCQVGKLIVVVKIVCAPKEVGVVVVWDEIAEMDSCTQCAKEETFCHITGVSAGQKVMLGLVVQQFDDGRVSESQLVVLAVERVAAQVQHRLRQRMSAVVFRVFAHQFRPLGVNFDRLVVRLQLHL